MGKYMVEYNGSVSDDCGMCNMSDFLTVNCAGYYVEDDFDKVAGMNIARERGRKDYLFCYVAKGTVTLNIEGQTHRVSEGFFCFPPNVPQFYSNRDTTGAFELFWIHFTGYKAPDLVRGLETGDEYFRRTGIIEEIPNSVETIVRELTFKLGYFESVAASLLIYILSITARRVASLSKNAEDMAVDVRMQKTLEHIYLYYAKEMSIKELADMCQLSVSRFSALFKQTFGLFPRQYIIRYRIKRACDLLRNTENSITHIAEDVGFDDPLYFSRVFRKQMNISPSQYRSNMNPEIYTINLGM